MRRTFSCRRYPEAKHHHRSIRSSIDNEGLANSFLSFRSSNKSRNEEVPRRRNEVFVIAK